MSNAFNVEAAAADAFGLAPMGGPKITFYKRSILNPFRSGQQGSPQYDVKDYIKIEPPGDTTQIVDREIKGHEPRQYAEQWAQYQNSQEQVASGTPLTFLFPGDPDIVDTLKNFKFHTVEQLANASDSALQAVPMGGFDFREKAKKFADMSKDAAKFHQIEKSLTDKDYKIKEQADLIAQMGARLAALEASQDDGGGERRGPGRPRKVEA